MLAHEQSGLTVVGTFLFPYEAHVARAALESSGIPAWVLDENQIRMEWHLAFALGGIKVAVTAGDAERARGLLRPELDPEAAPLPAAQDPIAQDPTGVEEVCPRCASRATRWVVEPRLPRGADEWLGTLLRTAASLCIGGLLVRRSLEVHCECRDCHHEWDGRAD